MTHLNAQYKYLWNAFIHRLFQMQNKCVSLHEKEWKKSIVMFFFVKYPNMYGYNADAIIIILRRTFFHTQINDYTQSEKSARNKQKKPHTANYSELLSLSHNDSDFQYAAVCVQSVMHFYIWNMHTVNKLNEQHNFILLFEFVNHFIHIFHSQNGNSVTP